MAEVSKSKNAKLFHVSTDYVFGGNEYSKPIKEVEEHP